MRRSGEALAGVFSPQPDRAEIIRWYESGGHRPGQLTDWQEACGLMVRLRVAEPGSDGRWLIRMEMFNPAPRSWRGGVALSDTPPKGSEAVLTVRAGDAAGWWAYLSPQPCLLFVRLDDAALMHF